MNDLVEYLSAALQVQHGSAALIAVLIVVLVVSVATVAVCGWLEWQEEAEQRSRSAEEREAVRMARRKGGCALRSASRR